MQTKKDFLLQVDVTSDNGARGMKTLGVPILDEIFISDVKQFSVGLSKLQ